MKEPDRDGGAAELAGRVILVTGATQGLGRAVALECARAGATVVLSAKHMRRLEAVYDEIEAAGYPQPAALPLDLATTNDHDLQQAIMLLHQQLGRLDGLVHCASHFVNLSPLQNQTLDDWLTILRVNLAAPAALTRAAVPALREAPDAAVVYTSESHGHAPKAYWGAYAVAKSGVETLVRIAADEWELTPQMRVNAIIPGPINSPLRAKTHPAEDRNVLPSVVQLAREYVYWLGPASRGRSGEIVEWRAPEDV